MMSNTEQHGRERILVVDEDAERREHFKTLFEQQGYVVLEAASGLAALNLLEHQPVEAVLTELLRPNYNSFQLCLEIRRLGLPVRVLVYTGELRGPQDEALTLTCGANRFLPKPATDDRLVDTMAEMLGEPLHVSADHLRTSNVADIRAYHERIIAGIETHGTALAESEERLARILEVMPCGVSILDLSGGIIFANSRAEQILGVPARSIAGRTYDAQEWKVTTFDGEELPSEDLPFSRVRRTGESVFDYEHALCKPDGTRICLLVNATPLRAPGAGEMVGVVASFTDITERKVATRLLTGQNQVLEQIANGSPLARTLESIAHLVESVTPQLQCSIALCSEDGKRMMPGAAPSLPADYSEALTGVEIGDGVGSCGTAMWRGEQVIVEDIRTDPLWANFRGVAEKHGLVACWSTPIFSTERTVLGSFAMYFKDARRPLQSEQDAIAFMAHLAGIAIQRSRASETLRESEARYRDLFDSAHDFILILGPDMKLRFANIAFREAMGFSQDELAQQTLLEIIHPEKLRECLENFRQVTAGGGPDRIAATFVTKDGRRIEVEGSCSCQVQDAQLISVRGIFRDVTERNRSELALQRQAALLDQSYDAVFAWEMSGSIVYWNKGAERLYGIPAEKALGEIAFEILQTTLPGGLARCHASLAATGHWEGVLAQQASDGRELAVDCRMTLVRNGGPDLVLEANRDITERRNAEIALRELTGRLMQAEDDERRRIAKELHDSTAQDLVAVLLNMDQLAATNDPDKAEELAADSRALLENCISEIRTLAYTLHPPRLDEAGLGAGLQEYAAGLAGRTDLRIRVEVDPDFGRLANQLELALFRIFQESLGNVLRHSESDAATVRLTNNGDEAILEVQDFGRGLQVASLEKPGAQGVGIVGMRERLERFGGRLEIFSTSRGTTVRAVVPTAKPL